MFDTRHVTATGIPSAAISLTSAAVAGVTPTSMSAWRSQADKVIGCTLDPGEAGQGRTYEALRALRVSRVSRRLGLRVGLWRALVEQGRQGQEDAQDEYCGDDEQDAAEAEPGESTGELRAQDGADEHAASIESDHRATCV